MVTEQITPIGFLILSGLPASGKSELARDIALRSDLPLLDKDDFLEVLFDQNQVQSNNNRYELSRVADRKFRDSALSLRSAILVSWWKHPHSIDQSGTPIEWLYPYLDTSLEIHCHCDPHIATDRFMTRTRHADHQDILRNADEQLEFSKRQATLGALGLCRGIKVNSEKPINMDALTSRIHASGYPLLTENFK